MSKFMKSNCPLEGLLILIMATFHLMTSATWGLVIKQLAPNNEPPDLQVGNPPSRCSLFKYVGVNDLSVNDIVVKSANDDTICIKARFSLAIKVEALLASFSSSSSSSATNDTSSDQEFRFPGESDQESEGRMILGYLPLDSVVQVEDSCPDVRPATTTSKPPSNTSQSEVSTESGLEPRSNVDEQLQMVVKFECGKLTFNFKKDHSFYLGAINGQVHLDSSTTKEFAIEQKMFLTSDLTHHFKFNELIEVASRETSKGFILTANFYNSEFETFRKTTSRSFIQPPDQNSKPFQDETNAQ